MKIKFQRNQSQFFEELNQEVKSALTPKMLKKADRLIKTKFFFYAFCLIALYVFIYSNAVASSFALLIVTYVLFGITGVLLGFNSSHDAVHNTLFKSKKLNDTVHYIIFSILGINGTLWKKRHIHSHHLFPNVDGCDADIDDSPVLRLSPSHSKKYMHRFQHIYAPFLYACYTLHWVLIKDFMYLRKKEVANMSDLNYKPLFIVETIAMKIFYFLFMIILPLDFTSFSLTEILIAFSIMHIIISLFFVFSLVTSHLTMETAFPVANEKGELPFNYHEHQLAVSMDYHASSKLANWIFGGFNSHSAHHLFPNHKHTLYTAITPFIRKYAKKHGLTHNELSIPKAMMSHFRYLKKLGTH